MILNDLPKIGLGNLQIVQQKRIAYSMFDDVIFRIEKKDGKKRYDRDKKVIIDAEKRAQNIVDEFFEELQTEKSLKKP